MRGTIIFSILFFFSFLVWRITERLSPDALGLATGVLLGILAGLPVALLILAASRRRAREEEERTAHNQRRSQLAMQQQPPVIIVSGLPQGYANGQAGSGLGPYGAQQHALPSTSDIVDTRQFHVIGEEDESVEEW